MKKIQATHLKSVAPSTTNNISSGYAIGQWWENITTGDKYFHKTDGVWVPISKKKSNIFIETSTNISTNTLDENNYTQDGVNVMISNNTSNIDIVCELDSEASFFATYTKLGSASITFSAASGITLVLVDGTNQINGIVGSTACLTRNLNTYYLQVNNR